MPNVSGVPARPGGVIPIVFSESAVLVMPVGALPTTPGLFGVLVIYGGGALPTLLAVYEMCCAWRT